MTDLKIVTTDNVDFTKHVNAMTAVVGYVAELDKYRGNRNRPNNKLYYPLKLAEECGEVAEVAVALEGSRRKLKKLGGVNAAKLSLEEELGDVFNLVFLIAEQHSLDPNQVIKAATRKLYAKRNVGTTHG